MKTKSIRQVLLLASLVVTCSGQAAEVAGVTIDDKVRVGTSDLVLNGAGLRTRFFFKVYVGALYAREKTSNVATLVDTVEPRRMALRMLRNIDANTLREALEEGLKNNISAPELSELKPQIDQLTTLMNGIGKVKKGDAVTLDLTAEGVSVGLNGEVRGKIPGSGLARALLKVWLGDRPVDASLKQALLGN